VKKLAPGSVALAPNPSANDGIDTIFTSLTVVHSTGIKGISPSLNFHLSTPSTGVRVTVYVHVIINVCVIS